MPDDLKEQAFLIRRTIEAFISERRDRKVAEIQKSIEKENSKAHPDMDAVEALERKRESVLGDHEFDAWMEKAASDAGGLSMITHSVKFTNPTISNKECLPGMYSCMDGDAPDFVATTKDVKPDVSADSAAYLYVYPLLNLAVEGRLIIDMCLEEDPALAEALGGGQRALEWMHCFSGIRSKTRKPASNTLARQIYWPMEDGSYHLLAPMFPTSLVQSVYEKMTEEMFGEGAKAARAAKAEGRPASRGFMAWPDILVRHYGGTKPQNVSQLNQARHGESRLLCSLPPFFHSSDVRFPLRLKTVFCPWLKRQGAIRHAISSLYDFLSKTDYNNAAIRETRAALVDALIDDVIQWGAAVAERKGWSLNGGCILSNEELCWLDPETMRERDPGLLDSCEWIKVVADRFANWMNAMLTEGDLNLTEDEYHEWRRLMIAALDDIAGDDGHEKA